MNHRVLGRTGLEVSVIGFGGGMLGSSNTDYAVRVVRHAIELGVNYFDTARSYRDSEIKLGVAVKNDRESVYISSKTHASTKENAWRDIRESLERLKTDYLDNYHLHNLRDLADIEERFGPEGALEALIEAKDKGIVRHIGCTSHLSDILVQALQRFDFETILVPMNLVEREPLDELIPLCEKKNVGVTVMKPLATGLLPAQLALKWLVNQPIATAVPGITTIEEVEEDALIGYLEKINLSSEENAEVKQLRDQLENMRCRICYKCDPSPQKIPIGPILGTDVMYDHYRTMGPEAFKVFPWDLKQVENHIPERRQRISAILSCTRCGECEKRCPYDLPIVELLQSTVDPMKDMLRIWREQFQIENSR